MRRLYPVIVGVLSISAACHNMSNNHSAAGELAAVVVFSNESLDQAAVYAVVPGGESIRIGTVMAGKIDTLTVPASIANSGRTVSIVARPLASSLVPSTGPVSIGPGDWISVRLQADNRNMVVLPIR